MSSCAICGEPLAAEGRACPICLEPRRRRKWRPRSWRWLFVQCVIFPLLFVATCTPLLKPAARMTDSQTHVPISDQRHWRFPVIVMKGYKPELITANSPRTIPSLPAGSSSLIPSDAEAIEKELNERYAHDREAVLKVDVEQIAPRRQRIEVYWINDGYRGGGYDATATSITPLYWKITGPGYAFIFGGQAMLMTAALWLMVALLVRLFRQIQGSSAVGP